MARILNAAAPAENLVRIGNGHPTVTHMVGLVAFALHHIPHELPGCGGRTA